MRRSPLTRTFAIISGVLLIAIAFASTHWSMQPNKSKLSFVGNQAGADFEGVFERFSADIRFDPQDLATSRFDVTIDLASVNSRDSERDDVIRGPDLFDVKQWPQAHYVAEKFTARGGGKYSANGKLTLHNVTRDVPIEFTFENKPDGVWLKGATKIKRLDFGVGQGDWKDTEWVGNEVGVKFALLLTK